MSQLYKANAVLFVDGIRYLVALRKKDERNLDINKSGVYGQRFRLQGNCVTPCRFADNVKVPKRCSVVLDPLNTDFTTVNPGDPGNIVGDFVLDEHHRTRWKSTECVIGQRFEGYVIPRRNYNAEIDTGSGNVQEVNEDDWN